MYYDLNVPWTPKDSDLQRKISFLNELGYNVLALTHSVAPDAKTGKLPTDLKCPIPDPLPFEVSASTRILRRLNITLLEHNQNHRLRDLASPSSGYDILAVRPTDEKTLQQACLSLECDLISLDLSVRYQFHFQYKMFSAALARGVRVELCYGPGMLGNAEQRRMLVQNAAALIRVTRCRGLVISSECRSILACRGPADIVNLAAIWGLGQERGVESVTTEAKKVVVSAGLKRTGYRGVIDVIHGGEKFEKKSSTEKEPEGKGKAGKRKYAEMTVVNEDGGKPLSNRQKKRLVKEARARAEAEGNEQRP